MVDEHISPDARPARPQDRLPLAALFFCVAAGPVAWTVFHLTAYPLTSYPCYPKSYQRLAPLADWLWVRPAMIGLGLAMLGVAAVGGWTSWRCLKRAQAIAAAETGSPLASAGRSRYFAICGIMASVLFAGAIVVDLIVLAGAPLCRD